MNPDDERVLLVRVVPCVRLSNRSVDTHVYMGSPNTADSLLHACRGSSRLCPQTDNVFLRSIVLRKQFFGVWHFHPSIHPQPFLCVCVCCGCLSALRPCLCGATMSILLYATYRGCRVSEQVEPHTCSSINIPLPASLHKLQTHARKLFFSFCDSNMGGLEAPIRGSCTK